MYDLDSENESKQAEAKGFFLPCPLHRLSQNCVSQVKGGLPGFKGSGFQAGLHNSGDLD